MYTVSAPMYADHVDLLFPACFSYWHHLSKSIFCLAAAGWGWGGRMKVSATRGCIPVIVQVRGRDGVVGGLSCQDYPKDAVLAWRRWANALPCPPPFGPQDGILVEFEEQLPMKEYAIRVPLWMVHKASARDQWGECA